jgi:hypothetical protein
VRCSASLLFRAGADERRTTAARPWTVTAFAEHPLAYAPALLLQDIAHSYRVWITLIKLLYALRRHSKSNPIIHLPE